MTTAIVPYQRREIKRGAVNVVQFATEGVAAEVRVDRVDRRNHASWYALRLASTESDVTGRLLGVLKGGETVDLGGLAVAPGSIGSARFAVTTPKTAAYETMYLEIRSEQVLLRVEAPKPPRRLGATHIRTGALLIAFGLTAAAGGEAVSQAVPRAPLLGVPALATAGSHVGVSYASRGRGSAAYTATTDDGTRIASGVLDEPNGTIDFALPASAAAHRVTVAVTLRGLLGAASGTASFAVAAPDAAPRPAAVARVLTFAARRDGAAGGESVLASYLAHGETGSVSLIDESGAVVASMPFTHRGTTRIAVPAALHSAPLIVRLAVRRGGTESAASIAVPPGAAPAPAATLPANAAAAMAEADVPEGVTPLDSASDAAHGGIIAVRGRAVAGRPLELQLIANSRPMHVELQNDGGETLAESTIAPGATRGALALPPGRARTKYFLVLHYERSGGEETVVRSVIAAPARPGVP